MISKIRVKVSNEVNLMAHIKKKVRQFLKVEGARFRIFLYIIMKQTLMEVVQDEYSAMPLINVIKCNIHHCIQLEK